MDKRLVAASVDDAVQQLWREHIRTLNGSIKQLGRDISAIKNEISQRDSIVQTTSYQTRNVEQLAQAGVADLRGRMVRCDTSIAQLAHDFRTTASTYQLDNEQLKQSLQTTSSKNNDLEKMVNELNKRMDQLTSEQEGRIEVYRGTNSMQMEAIDSRTKRIFEDNRMTIESNKRWAETERLRIEQQLMQVVELNSTMVLNKQEMYESKVMDQINTVQRAVDACNDRCDKCHMELKEKVDQSELVKSVESLKKMMTSELAQLKSEYREGFSSVRESIDTTNRLVNGKLKLMEDQLTREINNVKKMVVLI
ncbi:protein FAM81A [Ciona intestinalis]